MKEPAFDHTLPGELTDPYHSITPETERWFQHLLLQLPPAKDHDYLKVLPQKYGPWFVITRAHTCLRVISTCRTLTTSEAAAMRLACAVVLRIEMDAPVFRYAGHLCALGSVKRLLEACTEIYKYNTLTLPEDFRDPLFE